MTPDPADRRPTPPPSLRGAMPGLLTLAVATFVAITVEVLPVGLLPQIAEGVGVSESRAGLLVTIYALMVAALAIPLTALTRRLPRKPLLVGTLVGYAASNVVVMLAPGFAVLAVGRTLGGIAHALFFSVAIAYATRIVGPLQVGRALSITSAGGTAGFVLGVPLSTSLGEAVGWRWAFGVLVIACLLAAALVVALLPAVENTPPRDKRAAGGGHRSRLAIAATANSLVFLGHYTVYTYIAVILLGAGLRDSALGPVLLVFGALGLVGTAFAAWAVDRRPRLGAALPVAVVTATLVALGLALPHLVPVLLVCMVWLAAFGAMPPVFQAAVIRSDGVSPDISGAFVNTTANLGIGVGAALGGAVLEASGASMLAWVGAGIVALALVLVLVAPRTFPARP
ncbi:putative MFS family arabinose efflux permease [Sediminihabitans luteus]|uniref:Putative MFS family arabinose efflux permease n=1 Tax=Sediminihabitans luteus TaxID=1138585 RepID=A0A2M9D1D2_9CELL|nr:MFS transporter [Sediminihabitans luteus]PJJ77883.1 putative MFS family arabinose efflux permease [Sediminihabitans luteus]GII99759.1 MFS transporter [Sediminihabitans luteus]